jgi:hypothetical protein
MSMGRIRDCEFVLPSWRRKPVKLSYGLLSRHQLQPKHLTNLKGFRWGGLHICRQLGIMIGS